MHAIVVKNTRKITRFGERIQTTNLEAPRPLKLKSYILEGVVHLNHIQQDDTPVVINSNEYWTTNRYEDFKAMKLTSRWMRDKNKNFMKGKLAGCIRDNRLFLVVQAADETVRSIEKLMPVQVTGLAHAMNKMLAKFYS